ncbi:MAG: nuclear transport factor 2 family protein [Pseudomonadota bacterium]
MTRKATVLYATGTVMALAACAQTPDTVSSPIERVDAFYAALAAEDQETALGLLAPDAMLRAPYNPNGDATDAGIRSFPASVYVVSALQTYDNLVFEDREYSVADDRGTVWIEAEGRLVVASTGKPYENRYVFKIELSEAGITEITEYTNVATLARDGVTAGAR